jgi:hypothetical protein
MAKGKSTPKKKSRGQMTELQKAYRHQWNRITGHIENLEQSGFNVDRSFLPDVKKKPQWKSVAELKRITPAMIRANSYFKKRPTVNAQTIFKQLQKVNRENKRKQKEQQQEKQKAQTPKEVYSDNTANISGGEFEKPYDVNIEQPKRIKETYESEPIGTAGQYDTTQYEGADWLEDSYGVEEKSRIEPAEKYYPNIMDMLRGAKFDTDEQGHDLVITRKGEVFYRSADGHYYTTVYEKPSFIGNTVNLLDDLLPSNDYFTKAKHQNAFHQHATQRLKEVRRLIEMARKRVSEGEPEILNNISENFEEIDKTINGLIYTSDAEGVQDMRYSRLYELIFGEKLDAIAALALGDDEDYYDYLDGDDE